ncbi:ATP-grasp domain-containing protein [Paenibacillus sp. TRM 82003]|uniref:acetyl/propionyl/methylcrotonyl-CoA carboxylase subunit alpha n=1 Tax=Kineococcus sp. TRM81007 TaxID=2925831 RepID=UPI001F584D6D|nr:biotin carboxylase N-terminal domain-containing protein [Kineococcus sp. TRM81007]MCI2238328.1 ATP-grasp domain-containing protein [Kineococcus sp. TRM81007]MCI3924000.1 ATP-grasp domain-containing protein [Paenibacillus sp. TRM 82003]
MTSPDPAPAQPTPPAGLAVTGPVTKVLIANRGEIAVRVVRAARDAGIASVAVYSEGDRDALHVRVADEAYALGGTTARESYLDASKVVDVALRAGADAVHPGYGFLSENAAFAQAVIDAGLTWIGPPPAAIEALGDKVSARHLAARAGAPLVAGTPDPVAGVDEVLAFADEHGLPIAIKAAFGGGGRGLKVARRREEVAELFASAVREAEAAFGRGECFVERYLDRPRHVETQVLADAHGGAVVVSTRDCTLQRRHQKLVEEAPAPFLTPEQDAELRRASLAIVREAGYVGAGTVEFLVAADGTLAFLEVNTRLQVEHPVTEEVAGIDLVVEQFRIARGERLGYGEVATRGHAIEFRINGEDPNAGFLPRPGKLTRFSLPSGPGVRVDTGIDPRAAAVSGGVEISQDFDSLLAKLIVTGATREQALARAKRALEEFQVEGVPTVLPFHRAVVTDPAFAATSPEAFAVHTRWIETEFDASVLPGSGELHAADGGAGHRETIVVEVAGKRLEVSLPVEHLNAQLSRAGHEISRAGVAAGAAVARAYRSTTHRGKRGSKAQGGSSGNPDALVAPMQGTIVKVEVADGDRVEAGDLVAVLEAMKMEQPLTAHKAGTISGLTAKPGETTTTGTVVCEIVD